MRYLFISCITFLITSMLISCSKEVVPVLFKGPNGKDAYSMKCSGFGRTWDKCYQKAGQVCPNGYELIDKRSSTVMLPTAYGLVAAPKQDMAIECKE